MFRFTIRDLFWLTLLVALATVWWTDRRRQNARIQTLQGISELEAASIFPRDRDGIMAAVRNEKVMLKIRIDALTHELQLRGHRVELDDCGKIVVDRPFSQPLFPPQSNKMAK